MDRSHARARRAAPARSPRPAAASPSTSAPSSSGAHSWCTSVHRLRVVRACSMGIRSMPMSLAPTQIEPATCGSQVNGIADEHRGEQHRQIQPKQHAEYDAGHKMHRQGRGRNEGDEQAQREGAGDAVAVEGPAAAVEHERRKRLQTPEFLQRMAVRRDAFQPALHDALDLMRHYAVSPIRTVTRPTRKSMA